MTDPVSELAEYHLQITPLNSTKYKARVNMQLPVKDMGATLNELEDLFAYCVGKYGKTIFCVDLSLLVENLQTEYLQHLLHVNSITQKYFTDDEAHKEGGNHALVYGFAPYMETVINIALAMLSNHNIHLIQAADIENQVSQLLKL